MTILPKTLLISVLLFALGAVLSCKGKLKISAKDDKAKPAVAEEEVEQKKITITAEVGSIATVGRPFSPAIDTNATDYKITYKVKNQADEAKVEISNNNTIAPQLAASEDGSYAIVGTLVDINGTATFEFEFIWKFCSGANLVETPFANSNMSNTGTKDSPYRICTLAQLNEIRNALDAHYKLFANIDAQPTQSWGTEVDPDSGVQGDEYYPGWIPVGSVLNPFTGSFNGRNHTISNLHIKRPSEDYVGLFGVGTGIASENAACSVSPDFKSIKFENVFVEGHTYVGTLAGTAVCPEVTNISLSGEIRGFSIVGGLFGNAERAVMSKIFIESDTIGGELNVGGIAGIANAVNLSHCFSTGDVTVGQPLNGKSQAGGLIGYVPSSYGIPHLENCYTTGNVSSTGGDIGGHIGTTNAMIARNLYNTGSVSGGSPTSVWAVMGGIIGQSGINLAIQHVFTIGDISGAVGSQGGAGAIVGVGSGSFQIADVYSTGTVVSQRTPAGIIAYGIDGNVSRAYSTGDFTAETGSGSCAGGVIGAARGSTVDHSFVTGLITGTGDNWAHLGAMGTWYTDHATNVPAANFTNNFYVQDMVASALPGQLSMLYHATKTTIDYFQGPITTAADAGGIYETWDFQEVWSIEDSQLPRLRCPEDWPFDCETTWNAAQQ